VVVVEVNGYKIEPGADLQGAVLERTDLTRVDLEGADLRGAVIFGADLRRADLSGANLRLANLIAARADKNTIWPEGFDPKRAGVTFE
jgi:uncharacterized protein YjbI with pentapeptide repeats